MVTIISTQPTKGISAVSPHWTRNKSGRPIFLLNISQLYSNGDFSNLPYRWWALEPLYLTIMTWPDPSVDNQLSSSHLLDLLPFLHPWLIMLNCMYLHATPYPFATSVGLWYFYIEFDVASKFCSYNLYNKNKLGCLPCNSKYYINIINISLKIIFN